MPVFPPNWSPWMCDEDPARPDRCEHGVDFADPCEGCARAEVLNEAECLRCGAPSFTDRCGPCAREDAADDAADRAYDFARDSGGGR